MPEPPQQVRLDMEEQRLFKLFKSQTICGQSTFIMHHGLGIGEY